MVSLANLEAAARASGISYRKLVAKGDVVPRLITMGLHYTDTMRTIERIQDDDAWCGEWSTTAAEHEERGRTALARSRGVSAGQAFYRAALCYHFAQFMHFRNFAEKWAAVAKMVECYRAAMPFFVPPAEGVEAPFDGTALPGYLRLPPGNGKHPCLIILSGTDSSKQEYHHLENQFLVRGVATLSVDGPGQGETWQRMKWRTDWERATSAVVDYLVRRPEIDADRIGVLGLSFGGHLAVRSAAADDRLRACISFGGFYDTAYYDWSDPIRHIRFRYLCGTEDLDVAKSVARAFDLAGRVERVRVPMLIVHGRHDEIAPPGHAERVHKEAPHSELVMFEDGNHVCHNIPYKAHPLIADWVQETLRAPGRTVWSGRGPVA